MKKTGSIEKGFKGSLWLLYIMIVFEILYMISPFALYYYSLYKIPLNFLQSNPYTSFLTLNILPHFTSHSSILLSVLNFICWPFVVIGLLLFLYSFAQIYWAKFRRKGVVSKGLYTIIRHPQYLALAILGLGTTIYWSRFMVYIMYSTMLFLYYFLAKQEEKICLAKYGESYKRYLENTGMFFPKKIEALFGRLPKILPPRGFKRFLSLLILYFVYISVMIFFGFAARNYTFTKINAYYTESSAVVSVAPLDLNFVQKTILTVSENDKVKNILGSSAAEKYLIYVIPKGWSMPELGIGSCENQDYFSNPATHGNLDNFNNNSLIVFFATPVLSSGNEKGGDILKYAKGFIPIAEIYVDMKNNNVISATERKDYGKWDGIPVPVY